MEEEFTTIQIYRKDLKAINDKCNKDENLRDKLHEIIKLWEDNKHGNNKRSS